MKARKRRERWIHSHPHTRKRDAGYTQSECDRPCKGEKRENARKKKNTDERDLSVGFFAIRFSPLGHKA